MVRHPFLSFIQCFLPFLFFKDAHSFSKLISIAVTLIFHVLKLKIKQWLTPQNFVSRAYRDMRLMSIGAGTDEVMLSIICKYAGTLPQLPINLKKKEKQATN